MLAAIAIAWIVAIPAAVLGATLYGANRRERRAAARRQAAAIRGPHATAEAAHAPRRSLRPGSTRTAVAAVGSGHAVRTRRRTQIPRRPHT
jgi:hypothetical protein